MSRLEPASHWGCWLEVFTIFSSRGMMVLPRNKEAEEKVMAAELVPSTGTIVEGEIVEALTSSVPSVYLIETGEDCEGGVVLGIYTDLALAAEDFATEAAVLHDRWSRTSSGGVDDVRRYEDGVTVHAGCDWLTLSRRDLTTRSSRREITR